MFRTCIEIKKDGVQCGSPALRNSLRCHWHAPEHVIKELNRVKLRQSVANPEGRVQAVNEIIQALLRRQIDSKSAYTAIYGIQVATQLPQDQDFGDNSNPFRIFSGFGEPTK